MWEDQNAIAAVGTVDGKDFVAALEELKEDRLGLRGAARVFFRERFDRKVPVEVRIEWILRLAEVVFTDGLDEDKLTLLVFLESEQDAKIKSLLRDVMQGKVGKEVNRKKVFGQEPRLRAGAALSLVVMGDDTLKPEIEALLPQLKDVPDRAALEIALALLGDPSYIKTEQFRLQSDRIGMAGLKAIERSKGKQAMEALVKGGLHHPWGAVRDEALGTFERITGRKLSSGEIEDWWEVEHEGKRDRPQPILHLKGNTSPLLCVVFSPDGTLIAAGSTDSTAKVWNAQTGEKVHTLRGHPFTVCDLAFHPDGNRLATAGGEIIKIWDLTTGNEIRTWRGHEHLINRLAYSPDGSRLASASEDGTVRVWDPNTAKVFVTFRGHKHRVVGLAFRPDGQRIASCEKEVQIWDPASGRVERTLRGNGDGNGSLAYSPDGKLLATADLEAKMVIVWDAVTHQRLHTLAGHTMSVHGVSFSPDSKHIASTGWDKTVKIWDCASGKELVSFKAHPEWINAVAYSPDGKRLATASEDRTIRVWDVDKVLSSATRR
jgi:WD domain, G-beta repeat